MAMGYCRLMSDADLKAFADRAGLEIVHMDRDTSPWPHAILTGKE
jgi:hypothetical protein